MSRVCITLLDNDHPVEVLAVDGGAETSVPFTKVDKDGQKYMIVTVEAPQAVVLRELPQSASDAG